jgi:hypothetical protein
VLPPAIGTLSAGWQRCLGELTEAQALETIALVNHASRTTGRAALLVVVVALGGCASIAVVSNIPISTRSPLSVLKLANIDPLQFVRCRRLPVHLRLSAA